jgi:hypothetical protein
MARRSGDRGCFAVRVLGEHHRRRPRVDARTDEVQAYLLRVGRSRRGRNGLIASILRSSWIATQGQRKILLPKAYLLNDLSSNVPVSVRFTQEFEMAVLLGDLVRAGIGQE